MIIEIGIKLPPAARQQAESLTAETGTVAVITGRRQSDRHRLSTCPSICLKLHSCVKIV